MRIFFKIGESVTICGQRAQIVGIDFVGGYTVQFEDGMRTSYPACDASRLFNK